MTGNRLCSIALLFVGLNVFASGMFTALSNGVVSAVLAFSRSFLFTVASIQIMPVLLGGCHRRVAGDACGRAARDSHGGGAAAKIPEAVWVLKMFGSYTMRDMR